MKNQISEILMPEMVCISCIYLLETFESDFKNRMIALSLPSGTREDLKYTNFDNLLLFDDWKRLYDIKKKYLDDCIGHLKNKLIDFSIINYATLAGKHKGQADDELILADSNMIVDKHFANFNLDKIKLMDKNDIYDFVELINIFIEYGIIQFGINDRSKENIQMHKDGTFTTIMVFGLYNKIIYSNRDENRMGYADRKIFWIEIAEYLKLVYEFYSEKYSETLNLISYIHNNINNHFIDNFKKYV